MQIAIDCRLFGSSGIGTFIANIVNDIVSQKDVMFLLIGREHDLKRYKQLPNVEILATDIKPFSLKEIFFFPTRRINQCDAFFTPYINLPFGINIPVFSTIHDVIFFDLKGLTSTTGRWVRSFFYKHTCAQSRLIFTVSHFSQKRIIHHFRPKIPIQVIYNGVSDSIKTVPKENVTKKNYILYVGNIKPHKGLKTLIEAYNLATERGLNQTLMIVGEYRNFKTTDKEVIRAWEGNKENILFTGRLSDKQLIQTIQEAQVLVLPSLYEGFGIPPMEALYLGTEAIVSDIPALNEIYEDFPVNFFKAGSQDDLAKNLINRVHIESKEFEQIRKKIDEKYNFSITANQIIETIKAYI